MNREDRPQTSVVINSVDILIDALEEHITGEKELDRDESRKLIQDFIDRYNSGKAS